MADQPNSRTDEPTTLADEPKEANRKVTAIAMGAIFVFFLACFVVSLFVDWMPGDADVAGGFAYTVDPLYYFIYWTSVFFFILVGALMFVFAVLGRQQKHERNEVRHGATHNTLLELGWTTPPLILVLAFFLWGFRGYIDMVNVPDRNGAYLVDVEAYQWGWQFTYPNGGVNSGGSNQVTLDIPAGRPVRFRLSARDVLHSLYLPEQRIKKDCVPGRYNEMWVEVPVSDAITPGGGYKDFPLRCTEYCGSQHSQMNGILRVWHPDDWAEREIAINTWNKPDADGTRLSPVELGKLVHEQSGGCVSCHSVDGSDGNGPTWKNLYNEQRDGKPVDEAYILESIYYPNAYKVPGPYGQMASYAGQLNYGDVLAVDAYIKSLTEGYDQSKIPQEWPEGYDGTTWLNDAGEAVAPPLR